MPQNALMIIMFICTKKLIKTTGENNKISIRNIRREGNDDLKNLFKDKKITEDELEKFEKEMQILTDSQIKKIDDKITQKEKEIMKI